MPTPRQIEIAAEAITAAQFARCGFDVLVQYGAHQPVYDLVVERGEQLLKVSVKGSQDGSWGLTISDKKHTDYHGAIDKWLSRHGPRTVICLVQFQTVDFDQLPWMYLAMPTEIGTRMKESRNGHGDTILWKYHEWKSGIGAGSIDRIPDNWRFTKERIEEIFREQSAT